MDGNVLTCYCYICSFVRKGVFPAPDLRKLHLPCMSLHELSAPSLGNTERHYMMLFPALVVVSYCPEVIYISGGKTLLVELLPPPCLCPFRCLQGNNTLYVSSTVPKPSCGDRGSNWVAKLQRGLCKLEEDQSKWSGCSETPLVSPQYLPKKEWVRNAHLEHSRPHYELLGVHKQIPTFQSLDCWVDNSVDALQMRGENSAGAEPQAEWRIKSSTGQRLTAPLQAF